jgi:hypothetical protein
MNRPGESVNPRQIDPKTANTMKPSSLKQLSCRSGAPTVERKYESIIIRVCLLFYSLQEILLVLWSALTCMKKGKHGVTRCVSVLVPFSS